MKKKLLITATILVLLVSVSYARTFQRYGAHPDEFSMSFKLGYYIVSGDSDLWQYNEAIFLYDRSDLNSFIGTIAFNYHFNNYMTLTLEAGASYGQTTTEYADWVDEYGYPVETTLELGIVPLEVSIKINPFGRGHSVGRFDAYQSNAIIPYFGAGVGVYFYSYREYGDYIDFDYGYIVYGDFESLNVGVGYFVVGGIEIPMGNQFGFLAEYKYTWAEAPLSREFSGFEDFDIGGQSILIGFSMDF